MKKRGWLSKRRSLVSERGRRNGEEQLAIGRVARSPVAQIADKMVQPSNNIFMRRERLAIFPAISIISSLNWSFDPFVDHLERGRSG